MDPDLHPTPTALLARVREVHAARVAAEAELVQLAAAWADAHPDPDERPPGPPVPPRLGPDWVPDPGDPGEARSADEADRDRLVPGVDWRAPAAFAAAIGASTQAGEALIRDALTLRHRLPRVWARVIAGEVPVWRARRIAAAVHARPADVSTYLDAHLAAVADRVGVVTLDRLLDEAMLRLHAEERELEQLEALDRTHVTVHEGSLNHVGIAEATIRADWKDLDDFSTTLTDLASVLEPTHAGEPFEARRARAVGVLADPAHAATLLARETPTESTQPTASRSRKGPGRRRRRGVHLIVHTTREALTNGDPVARVETPTGGAGRPHLAQQVAAWCARPETDLKITQVIDLNQPVEVDRYEIPDRLADRTTLAHPTCTFPWCTRPARSCDKDHVIPHNKGGPTTDTNLAPLCRRHHRLKTHTAWHNQTLDRGIWLWTDPHGHTYLRTHHGTKPLTPPEAEQASQPAV